MGQLKLEVFRFNARTDYEFYFQKIQTSFSAQTTLKDILSDIEDLAFDSHIALRVNGICVLENVTIGDLVRDFGNKLVIEPLSKEYVSKDLLLDKEALFARYADFFKQHSFISSNDQYELHKFLHFNMISLQGNPDYLGDGFFMYVRWLLESYGDHFQELINYLAHPKNGIMSHTNIQNLLYIPNQSIEDDAMWLQEKVLSFGQYKENKNVWPIFKADLQKSLPKLACFKNPSSESNDAKATFALFNGYTLQEAKPLIQSSKALLRKLEKRFVEVDFCFTGGHLMRLANKDLFLLHNAYNLALAKKCNATLLFADYESFLEAQFAIEHIIPNDVNKILNPLGLHYEEVHIAYIGEIIAENISSASQSSHKPKSVLYARGSHPDMSNLGVDFIDIVENGADFSGLELFNQEYYLKDSARMRFAGIDMGVDFLAVSSVAQFRAFDTFAKKSAKALGRDADLTPSLFLPQIGLLALGEKDKKVLGLNYHKLS